MTTVSASEARQTLPAQLDRVEAGEQVRITRHGRVVAVLVSPDALRSPRAAEVWAAADEIGARLDAARRRPLTTAPLSDARAEELVRAVRESRESR